MRHFVLTAAAAIVLATPASAQVVIVQENDPFIPEEVTSYVVEEDVPSVSVAEQIVVGEELPDVVVIRRVPRFERYGYAVINERPVVVEATTRRVIEVLD